MRLQDAHCKPALTTEEAGHLLRIVVSGNASSCGAHVGTLHFEGQQLAAIVSELCVDPQQSLIRGEVPE